MSKLRENNKVVIGVGVKSSTSDLLMNNCDEFILYDDLARDQENRRRAAARSARKAPKATEPKETDKAQEAIALVLETVEALYAERGEEGKIWSSMVKQALKRRKPSFNESYYGFRSFSQLLLEAQKRKLLQLELDEKSGNYLVLGYHAD